MDLFQVCRHKAGASADREASDGDDSDSDTVDGAPLCPTRHLRDHRLGHMLVGDGEEDSVDGTSRAMRPCLVSPIPTYSKDSSHVSPKRHDIERGSIDANYMDNHYTDYSTTAKADIGVSFQPVYIIKERAGLDQQLEKLRKSNTTLKRKVDEDLKKLTRLENLKEDIIQRYTCSVDLENPANRAFMPCRHLVACQDCAPKLKSCPLCRHDIRAIIHVDVKMASSPLIRRRRPPKPALPGDQPTSACSLDSLCEQSASPCDSPVMCGQ